MKMAAINESYRENRNSVSFDALLTEMSTRNLPGGKGRPARKADLTAICEPIVYKMWEPRRLTTLWASTACYRDSFTFYYNLRGP
jgi:hypothetical protein